MRVDALLHRVSARLGTRTVAVIVGVTLSVAGVITRAQGNAAGLEVLQIRPNFYMIVGAGANIGAQIGPNGVVLVNAGTAEASGEVVAAVAKLTTQPIRYIIDTSADPDVVGGNAKIVSAGRNITSFAARPAIGRTTIVGTDARRGPSPLARQRPHADEPAARTGTDVTVSERHMAERIVHRAAADDVFQ